MASKDCFAFFCRKQLLLWLGFDENSWNPLYIIRWIFLSLHLIID